MNVTADVKDVLREGWRSIAEGWHHVRQRAGHAITPFRRNEASGARAVEDDVLSLASPSWGVLAGEVFEDANKVTVRLEAPGMDVKDFDLQAENGVLHVRGEKRASRESTEGAWRLTERAYGSFERSIRLPCEVRADKATASYRRGVLTIELPKVEPRAPKKVKVKVQ